MAKGRPPKPSHLRLIDGTHRPTRHGPREDAKNASAQALATFGPLIRPKGLRPAVRKAWDRFITPAGWLDGSREPAARAFCELWAEFMDYPTKFPAAKHTQMRAYMGDLGLSDERNRAAPTDHDHDEFFGDD